MKLETKSRLGDMEGNGAKVAKATKAIHVQIAPPNLKVARFTIKGTAPLVVHRFSSKTKQRLLAIMEAGSTAKKGKKREPLNAEQTYNEARYISKAGWDGFNAAAIRAAMISACRLVGFKMTLAKLCVFVIADGVDAKEPQYSLIRIYGKPRRLDTDARVETGQPYICIRPIYDDWKSEVTIEYDADIFTIDDIANLLARVGKQVGLCEGRPDSKNSAGMGWGTFAIQGKKQVAIQVKKQVTRA